MVGGGGCIPRAPAGPVDLDRYAFGVRDAVRRGLAGRERDLEVGIETAVGKILDHISNGLVVDNVVSADRAAEIFQGLEELGLVAGRETIEKRVDELVQERLAVLKSEFV